MKDPKPLGFGSFIFELLCSPMKQTMYGVDIATRRADDLDKKMVTCVTEHKSIQGTPGVSCMKVLDLGCGGGGQSVRLVQAGALVTGVDLGAYSETFDSLRAEYNVSAQQLMFLEGNMTDLSAVLGTQAFQWCCFQRTLHYVPYVVAHRILTDLRNRVNDKLYISVSGVESDIGRRYMDAGKAIQDRFCQLDEIDAETFGIRQPVCLYTPEEFIGLLLESGWNVEECWVSAFGNIKAVCGHKKSRLDADGF